MLVYATIGAIWGSQESYIETWGNLIRMYDRRDSTQGGTGGRGGYTDLGLAEMQNWLKLIYIDAFRGFDIYFR